MLNIALLGGATRLPLYTYYKVLIRLNYFAFADSSTGRAPEWLGKTGIFGEGAGEALFVRPPL